MGPLWLKYVGNLVCRITVQFFIQPFPPETVSLMPDQLIVCWQVGRAGAPGRTPSPMARSVHYPGSRSKRCPEMRPEMRPQSRLECCRVSSPESRPELCRGDSPESHPGSRPESRAESRPGIRSQDCHESLPEHCSQSRPCSRHESFPGSSPENRPEMRPGHCPESSA